MSLWPLYYINVSMQFSVWFSFRVYVCVCPCAHVHMCTCRTQTSLFEIVLHSSSTLFPWDRVFQTNPEFINTVCPHKQLAPGPSLSLLSLNEKLQESWWAHLALMLLLLTQTWSSCFPTTLQPWNPSDVESQRFIYFYSVCLNIMLGWMDEQHM